VCASVVAASSGVGKKQRHVTGSGSVEPSAPPPMTTSPSSDAAACHVTFRPETEAVSASAASAAASLCGRCGASVVQAPRGAAVADCPPELAAPPSYETPAPAATPGGVCVELAPPPSYELSQRLQGTAGQLQVT